MLDRKPLTPNNRTSQSMMREFGMSEALYIKYPKNGERQSIFSYVRSGRQNSEGFGGGYRITK